MRRALRELLAGNAEHAGEFGSRFEDVQDGQRPVAVTVCCADSRVLGDHLWGNDEPGRLFSCGNIGNRVVQRTGVVAGSGERDGDGDVVSGDVLYPLLYAGTDAVVVVGHTGCGAVTATYDHLQDGSSQPPGIEHCVELLRPHLEPGVEALPSGLDRAAAVNHLVEYNVDRQVEALVESEDVPDGVTVLGGVYDFQDVYSDRRGEVHVVTVDGERDVDALREAHPEVADRIRRRWTC